jgi:MtaA/CmuA family methyltransferase
MVSEKNRLLWALSGAKVDRPSVICPGGMMSAATTKILTQSPQGFHQEARAMADAALAIRENSGFENLGVPFCMTAEAEILGAEVNLGDARVEPLVSHYVGEEIGQILAKPLPKVASAGRIPAILEAISILKKECPEVPVIGNLTGPISLVTSLMEPMLFFKKVRRDPRAVHEVMEYINTVLIEFAREQIKSGVNVIAIADPTATGEILGPKNFNLFVTPYLNKLVAAIHAENVPVIVHICGDASTVIEEMEDVRPNALSFDAIVNMGKAKERVSNMPVMGNLSTQLLHQGIPEKIQAAARLNQNYGVDIHAPACGISLATPKENLQAFTSWVKNL